MEEFLVLVANNCASVLLCHALAFIARVRAHYEFDTTYIKYLEHLCYAKLSLLFLTIALKQKKPPAHVIVKVVAVFENCKKSYLF